MDARTPSLTAVRAAYTARAADYIDLFGSAATATPEDRAVVTAWGRTVVGPVLDAGCGPGQWSAHLRSLGLQVSGVDATPAFVQHAARSHPDVDFRVGDLRALDPAPGSLGGVLAWFSLIHLDPGEIEGVVCSISVALRPEGTLLIGFFSAAALQPFDHRVVTAWAWPLPRMLRLLEAAGLEVRSSGERPGPAGRVLAHAVARRVRPARGAASHLSAPVEKPAEMPLISDSVVASTPPGE